MTLGHQLKALDAMNNLRLGVKINDSGSRAQAFRDYEQLKPMVDMKHSSHELRDLDVMHSLGLWLMTLGHELKVLDDISKFGLWLT